MGGTKERRGWGFKVCCARVSTAGGLKGKGADKCIGYRVLRNLRRAEAWKGLGRSGSRKWSGLRVVRKTPGDQEAESGLKAQVGTQQTRSEVQARIIWEHKSTGLWDIATTGGASCARGPGSDTQPPRCQCSRPPPPWQLWLAATAPESAPPPVPLATGTRDSGGGGDAARATQGFLHCAAGARSKWVGPGGGCERGAFGVLRGHRLPRVRQSSLTPKTARDALNKWGDQGSAIGPFRVDSEMVMGTRPGDLSPGFGFDFSHHAALPSTECSETVLKIRGHDSQNAPILPKGVREGVGTYSDKKIYSWKKTKKSVRRVSSPCVGIHWAGEKRNKEANSKEGKCVFIELVFPLYMLFPDF